MGFRRRFIVGLLWRVALLLGGTFAFVQALVTPGLGAARLVAAMLLVAAVASLLKFVQRTNVELARFVDAVRFGDFSQNFSHSVRGSGFGEMGQALDQGIRTLRDERHRLSDINRFYEAILDDAPTPLLTIDDAGRIELVNKAARRLFARHTGVQAADFEAYGLAFASWLAGEASGPPRLIPILFDAVPQAAMVGAAVVHRLGGHVRIVSVQLIQTQLNAIEVSAQSDLVRVLTHEIMNSMTPVTSLAHSAAQLIAAADTDGNDKIGQARLAVETLSRRADGVMHFVETYRQITRVPEIRRRLFDVLPWARELEAIFGASDASAGVALTLTVEPAALKLDGDADLLCQVLINLLRNAAEAARSHAPQPAVWLRFGATWGGRVRIEVADNGPGVPPSLKHDVFLPFFTTKAEGTGVGLSLARQIILAHGGSIALAEQESGGALFQILI